MNDELKRNIWGGVNRSNNRDTLDLQLFSSNPYVFTLDGNYNINATIESSLVDLSDYASDNIENYQMIIEIPQEHLDYLNSGLVATDMHNMFGGCSTLTDIPNLNIDTSQCTDMSWMFYDCQLLTSLEISNFDTSNVTDMNSMFNVCRSLTSLDLSNFDTSNVTNMSWMFTSCQLLTSLEISNFNTSKVTNMNNMFASCMELTSLNLSNFNTSKVTNMNQMFSFCHSLNTIEGIIDMRSCTIYSGMFDACFNLREVKIKNPPANFDPNIAGLMEGQYTIVS